MPTVLVIEDDPDMRTIEQMMLECMGYTVRLAGNGREGLRSLQDATPCVILLDLMMPVMDGLSFLRERARLDTARTTPVVCVSAAGPDLVNQALALGAAECVPKPAELHDLCDAVARYCATPPPS